jgi:uncharacterized protein YbbK (DUF523 family)
VAGGLPTPRDATEVIVRTTPELPTYDLVGGHAVLKNAASVQTQAGVDVSAAFIKRAQIALNLCLQNNIHFVLLSACSPSCGNRKIYSGQFNKTLIEGLGVTAALLKNNGIGMFNKNNIEELGRRIKA